MSSSIAGTSGLPTTPSQTDIANQASAVRNSPAVGTGNVGQGGPAPAPPSASTMSAVMASLFAMMPKESGEKLQVELLKVMTKIRETIGDTEEGKIRVDQESKRLALQEKQGKITDAEDKRAAAQEKREKLSVWDKVKIAFQYIGAITAFIGGALALATSWLTGPAGVVAGVLLISAGVILLGMAADATYTAVQTEKTGKQGLGMVGEIHKAVLMDKGMSEEDAYQAGLKADTIGRIVATSVAGALMLGAAIAGGVSAFQLGFAVINYVQGTAGIATNTIGAATTIASGTGDIVVAKGKKDATDLDADSKKLTGEAKIFEALAKFLDDMIDVALTRLKGMHETVDQQIDALTEAVQDIGATYGRVGSK